MSDCTCGRDGWGSPAEPDCPDHGLRGRKNDSYQRGLADGARSAPTAREQAARDRPVELRDEDLQFIRGCAAQHPDRRGGQHVAMECAGVLVIHRPTGIAVRVDEERSQLKCQSEALRRLRLLLACYEHAPQFGDEVWES